LKIIIHIRAPFTQIILNKGTSSHIGVSGHGQERDFYMQEIRALQIDSSKGPGFF
jgi:hypothetical protein